MLRVKRALAACEQSEHDAKRRFEEILARVEQNVRHVIGTFGGRRALAAQQRSRRQRRRELGDVAIGSPEGAAVTPDHSHLQPATGLPSRPTVISRRTTRLSAVSVTFAVIASPPTEGGAHTGDAPRVLFRLLPASSPTPRVLDGRSSAPVPGKRGILRA